MNSEGKDVFSELSDLVETLTTSGSPSLDQELFKRVKNICKTSDENVRHLYRMVMTQLEKQHAEVRLSSVQIINEIFSRSHVFRELLTENFQQFLELAVGTNADLPLPEPANVATTLKTQSFQAIKKWHEKYGLYYKKLALGYNYLKRVKQFEFDAVRSHTVSDAQSRQRAQDAETRRRNLAQQKLNIVLTQMGESVSEIKNTMTEMDNCFQLVLPCPEEFDIYEGVVAGDGTEKQASLEVAGHPQKTNDHESASTSDNVVNNHGLGSCSYHVTLSTFVEIAKTSDNSDILNTLGEQQKLITNKYIPQVQQWLDILTKHSGHNENLIQAIDLKNSLTGLKQKFESLKVISMENSASTKKYCGSEEEDEEPEGEEFVDVPEKQGVEYIAESKRHEYGLETSKHLYNNSHQAVKDKNQAKQPHTGETFHWNPKGNLSNPAELADPCSRAAALAAFEQKLERKPVTTGDTSSQNSQTCVLPKVKKDPEKISSSNNERRAELLRKAPVVPFDMDLYNWERNEDEAPPVTNLESLNCFWVHGNGADERECPDDIRESMKSRSITFTGNFQEVKWSCRVPLPSGKLCPRMDRYKCPFHGKIIPRDKMGQPRTGDSDVDKSLNRKTVKETEEITRDVELATGMDLGSKKMTKGKKRKHPGLTDLKKNVNTSRSRLEKIVFDKSSLERVADKMGDVRMKLIDEKFGNNWNYALRK